MVEVIHEREVSSGNNVGFILGIVLLIAALIFFFYYGAALFRQMGTSSQPTIQVPDKVDVNVNQPQQ